MLSYEETKYRDLKAVCRAKYGAARGDEIYRCASNRFTKLVQEMDDRGSSVIRRHMTGNIFPVLAYYTALLDAGLPRESAYANVLEETQKHARAAREQNAKIARLPMIYHVFRFLCKRFMARQFPVEGWETEWVRRDQDEVHFNLKRCVYAEVTARYGHPELCTVFCQNDVTAFAGYLPAIRFYRNGAIGEGAPCCDFHFQNEKRKGK